MSEEDLSEAVVASPSDPPKVGREAEHKLKEMSRKAKERKTAQNASKHPKGLNEKDYFWLIIGGLGAFGVGYLVFGKKEPEPKARPRFKFVPRPELRSQTEKTPEKERQPVDEKEEKTTQKFELNCF